MGKVLKSVLSCTVLGCHLHSLNTLYKSSTLTLYPPLGGPQNGYFYSYHELLIASCMKRFCTLCMHGLHGVNEMCEILMEVVRAFGNK